MSAVTKVLVVLLVVLCIAFSMTAISFTAQTANWKELAEDDRSRAQVSDAHQRNLMASHAAELASARDTIKNHQDRISLLETGLQDSQEQVSRLQGDLAQLGADKRRGEALAQRLTNELSVAQASRTAIDEQRREFESRNIDLERRNIDLTERVNELTTQVAVQFQKIRQQEQQINIVRQENEKLAQQRGVMPGAAIQGAGALGTVVPLQPGATATISGHVVAVSDRWVTISVGSADQVQKGITFVIYRAQEYVGDLEITDVEPNLSAGRLVRKGPGAPPKKGDKVVDEFHFTGR